MHGQQGGRVASRLPAPEHGDTDDNDEASSQQSADAAARLVAHLLAKQTVADCLELAASRVDSRLRTVLTYSLSALVGTQLTVITIGFVFRSQQLTGGDEDQGASSGSASGRAQRRRRAVHRRREVICSW